MFKQVIPGVDVLESGFVKGLWITDGDQTIGLIEQEGVGGYLAIYKTTKRGLPLAVTFDGVQLPSDKQPGVDGTPYRFIKWDTLFEMVEEYEAAKDRLPS